MLNLLISVWPEFPKKEGPLDLLSTKGSHACMSAKLLWLWPTLCDLMDCSPPGSPVHGILQARTLEWAVTPSFRGSAPPRR